MEHHHERQQRQNSTRVSTASKVLSTRPGPGPTPGNTKKHLREGKMVLYRTLNKIDKVRRVFRSGGILTSSAAGVITAFNIGAASVTSAPDWTNFSQEYSDYRVYKQNFSVFPSTVSATATTGPYQSVMSMSRYWGLLPTTISHISQDTKLQNFSTLQEGSITTNFEGFLDAQQWTPVGTGISSERNYGFGGCSLASVSALPVSSNIFSYIHTHYVEFFDAY
jgi:hypothetical protein